jgi:hypothetical protein
MRRQKSRFEFVDMALMTKCLAGMRGAITKQEENKSAVGEALSASRHLRNECRHESLFKDIAIDEGLGRPFFLTVILIDVALDLRHRPQPVWIAGGSDTRFEVAKLRRIKNWGPPVRDRNRN